MSGRLEKRSPAPRGNAEHRGEGSRNGFLYTIESPSSEADFAAQFIARRYRLPLPFARMVCNLASIGRACA